MQRDVIFWSTSNALIKRLDQNKLAPCLMSLLTDLIWFLDNSASFSTVPVNVIYFLSINSLTWMFHIGVFMSQQQRRQWPQLITLTSYEMGLGLFNYFLLRCVTTSTWWTWSILSYPRICPCFLPPEFVMQWWFMAGRERHKQHGDLNPEFITPANKTHLMLRLK